jgi:hypothetical protein
MSEESLNEYTEVLKEASQIARNALVERMWKNMSTPLFKRIEKRLEDYGLRDAISYSLAASIVSACEQEADKWTGRTDDAKRIPDMLHDAFTLLLEKAKEKGMTEGTTDAKPK